MCASVRKSVCECEKVCVRVYVLMSERECVRGSACVCVCERECVRKSV